MAQHFALIDETGRAQAFFHGDIHAEVPEGASEIPAETWRAWVEDPAGLRWKDGALVAAEVPLASLKREAKSTVQLRLDEKLLAGMPWEGKVLQVDEKSQALISSSALMASLGVLPEGFSWRMADNSFLPLDAAGMTAMATAAGAYVNALKRAAWALIDAIGAAADKAALAAIDLDAGWPG